MAANSASFYDIGNSVPHQLAPICVFHSYEQFAQVIESTFFAD